MSKSGLFDFLRPGARDNKNTPGAGDSAEHKERDLNEIYQSLATAFSTSLNWHPDDRFAGVLAEFDIEAADSMQAAIRAHLPVEWDSNSIKGAPKNIRKAMESFGGLQPGQLVFTSDPGKKVTLLGLWWPWANGSKISIRFIPVAARPSKQLEKSQAVLKQAFGIQ
jgi:hypothetical protein